MFPLPLALCLLYRGNQRGVARDNSQRLYEIRGKEEQKDIS
jgi:hypothetical protein